MRAALSFLIRAYQLVVSPWLGSRCRFSPGCSEYALEALQKHGTWRGSWLALRRLSRCHPWHAGGHDPVPDVWPASSTGNPLPHSCRHHP